MIAERTFYLRLHVRRRDVKDVVYRVRKAVQAVDDMGMGTEAAPGDCWVEVRHLCHDSGDLLARLASTGVTREMVGEVREIAPKSGHLMARQPSLF